jgi:hypothetical protein
MRQLNERKGRPYKIEVMELPILEELCMRYRDLVDDYFPEPDTRETHLDPRVREEYFEIARDIWRGPDRVSRLHEHFKAYQKRFGNLEGSDYSLFFSDQQHRIQYFQKGISRSTYTVGVMNIGGTAVHTTHLTVFGVVPVTDNQHLRLGVLSLAERTSVLEKVRFAVDTHNLKVIELQVPGGIPPLGTYRYRVIMDWPYLPPLEGMRHYTMPVFRFTGRLSFEVIIPSRYRAINPVVLGGRDPWFEPAGDIHSVSRSRAITLSGEIELPVIGNTYKVVVALQSSGKAQMDAPIA